MKRSVVILLAAAVTTFAPSLASAADQFGSALSGQAVWVGAVPEAKELNVNKDQEHCLGKGKIHSEEFVINKDSKGVKNVFVWLQPVSAGAKMPVHESLKNPPKEVGLDQPQCAFIPHCQGMQEGQTLVAKNSAPVAHNVKWAGGLKNPGSNVIIPAGKDFQIKGLKADSKPVAVNCNIHTWMSGWVMVFNHPYFAVTDTDGKFEIKNPPAGEYKLMVWHEGAGYGPGGKDGKKITIKADGATDAGKIELKK